ncbi:MAG: UbiD family decarboxylase [Betaproteobacteria bacterium]|nr:UbiD family decarboxylase [Betaproteobacteria bacterium]
MAAKEKNSAPARAYPDLHEHIRRLKKKGLLRTVDIPINKDTEMHPLVRWQYRGGIPEKDRGAFLFTNVYGSDGRKYDMPVIIGAMAASAEVYATGLGCTRERIAGKWARALAHPIAPGLVKTAPCQDIVAQGKDLARPGKGLDIFPIPVSTPGYDNAPYIAMSFYVTKDPETGVQNLGGYTHWKKWKKLGKKMPAAIVLGGPPCVLYVGGMKIPEGVDELTVAGGLVGRAINVVKARTVDLLVPAEAEIVIEGTVDTEYLEPEAPFGESHGHVNLQEYNCFMDVTAITRRRDAVFMNFIDQLAPSESSVRSRVTLEDLYTKELKSRQIRGFRKAVLHEPLTGARHVAFLLFERGAPDTEVWRALYAAVTLKRSSGKIVIAVSDDIDPENLDAVLWSLAYRFKPHLDLKVVEDWSQGHGPRDIVRGHQDSALLVNAVLKHDMAPVALLKRQYMERAREIWEKELGWTPLKPEMPWFGYSLGAWTESLDREAELAVKGDYWETGKLSARRRRKDLAMNTEIRFAGDDEGKTG